jgi:hypothetical protein
MTVRDERFSDREVPLEGADERVRAERVDEQGG